MHLYVRRLQSSTALFGGRRRTTASWSPTLLGRLSALSSAGEHQREQRTATRPRSTKPVIIAFLCVS